MVYSQLRSALINGDFDPGQALTISLLAGQFGTSHMPVREALRRLAAENALDVSRNGSARVPPVTLARLDDLCRARVAVEGLAVELGTRFITAEDLARLVQIEDAHTAAAKAGNVYSMLVGNRDFHFAIYRASGSDVLVQLIDTLWLRFGPYMRMLSKHVKPLVKNGTHEPYIRQHLAILAAIDRRDEAQARAELERDITITWDLLKELCG
ncbi:GntR family transcriptional regulator [Tianweitania sp. BSSL-BM11]|uniref:GntR family transcriptional regulator n=2 Tax=Tianweitania aestuarii TaxID=2814886 RepID=A0ABS5RXT8_9HYPH|nr:GntR family transcriptional regulator [Tianweitania aestuarii]